MILVGSCSKNHSTRRVVQHDYYQIVILPSISILCGFGAVWMLSYMKRFTNIYVAGGVVGVCMILGFWFGWEQVRDYFNINNPDQSCSN